MCVCGVCDRNKELLELAQDLLLTGKPLKLVDLRSAVQNIFALLVFQFDCLFGAWLKLDAKSIYPCLRFLSEASHQ